MTRCKAECAFEDDNFYRIIIHCEKLADHEGYHIHNFCHPVDTSLIVLTVEWVLDRVLLADNGDIRFYPTAEK